jgi:hypothetical protein
MQVKTARRIRRQIIRNLSNRLTTLLSDDSHRTEINLVAVRVQRPVCPGHERIVTSRSVTSCGHPRDRDPRKPDGWVQLYSSRRPMADQKESSSSAVAHGIESLLDGPMRSVHKQHSSIVRTEDAYPTALVKWRVKWARDMLSSQ